MIGISNEPPSTITRFVEDQGITFPVLHDDKGTYYKYNIPGSLSPYPRDFIIDKNGMVKFAKTEYDPAAMISMIEGLIDYSTVSIEDQNSIMNIFELHQNFPNPFNPNTTIEFSIATAQEIQLNIINLNGQTINTLFPSKLMQAGTYREQWNGKNNFGIDMPTGIYFAQMKSSNSVLTKKMLLIR